MGRGRSKEACMHDWGLLQRCGVPAHRGTGNMRGPANVVSGCAQVMQIYQMDAMNFHFVAHPNAWVVHRPHAPSSGYNHTFTGEAYTLKHKPTDHLWKMERIAKDMMAELKASSYPDEGVTQLAACREGAAEVVQQSSDGGAWW